MGPSPRRGLVDGVVGPEMRGNSFLLSNRLTNTSLREEEKVSRWLLTILTYLKS